MRINFKQVGSILMLIAFVILAIGSGTTERSVQNKDSNAKEVPIIYKEIPFSDLRQSIASINEPGHGFIVEAFIELGDPQRVILCDSPLDSWIFPPKNAIAYRNGIIDSNEDMSVPLTDRFDRNITYKVYISARLSGNSLYGVVDRIEGLLTQEQAKTLRAQRNAEERAAYEEANRYDPAKFIIVPSNFRPANYTRADLFEAVATSEKLSTTPDFVFNTPVYKSIDFVSDVVFVSQSGTDIIFKTADNAINRRMKVESRTGLTAGQRVRIYYTAYRIQPWQVVAIERL